MTNIAKQALKEINEKLKNSEVDNDNLLMGHRINHKKDMEQICNVKVILSEEIILKIVEFANQNHEQNYREFGTYFYGRMINNIIYISGYTGTDFCLSDGVYNNGAVDVSEKSLKELESLTQKIENPYNIVVHFHTHPSYVINNNGVLIKPASNFYSENDLYSYAYHQVYMQPNNSPVIYLGGLIFNNLNSAEINFVFYDSINHEFCNLTNMYYLMNNNIYKINNGIMTDNSIISGKEKVKIKENINKMLKNYD